MKIFGEAFKGLGRWYLALPPLLLIAFLAGLFMLATEGQSRLEAANVRLQKSELRQRVLGDFLSLIVDSETAQRGYLITANEQDLLPYKQSIPRIDEALNQLREAYTGDPVALAQVRTLRLLSGKKMGELEASLDLAGNRGMNAAMDLLRTGAGRKYMTDIRQTAALLRERESVERSTAIANWQADLRVARWITGAGAVLNLLLVVVAVRLVYMDLRRRARQAADLQDQKAHLEGQVEARTQELAALSTHLQEISEKEKHALSRELHDELGGLLVAARMDLSWLQRKLPTDDATILQRFTRIQESLTAGVNLKRRVVEELRPTLLDNMGLFSALRWQVKETCGRAGIKCGEKYPDEELQIMPHASIAIFRTVQESLINILKHSGAKSVDLAVEVLGSELVMQISDDGKGLPADRLKSLGSHGLASMRHRITSLGGRWTIGNLSAGGTVITARVPLSNILLSEQKT